MLLNELEYQKGWEHTKKFQLFYNQEISGDEKGNFHEDECQMAGDEDD